MKMSVRSLLCLALLPILASWALSGNAATPDTAATLARIAVTGNGPAAKAAIAALRSQGPTGLEALCATYDARIQKHLAAPNAPDPLWPRLTDALDAVGQQRDCYASRLYWYTDMAQAKKAAAASGKPILSLRLLGNLNEELSCANSRFFRTALYPNAQISAYLRAHYILHWKSVRPVPIFTLDFGDGRKIVRTLTGNSIHYVLDSQGRPVDALPGLYGPQAFLKHLIADEDVARRSGLLTDTAQRDYIQTWHAAQWETLSQQWTADSANAYGPNSRIPTLAALIAGIGVPRAGNDPPSAGQAAPRAISKAAIEIPVVTALSPGGVWALGASRLEWDWDQIGRLHADDAVLDANSRALMASKHPDLSRVSEIPTPTPQFGFGGSQFGDPSVLQAAAVTPSPALSPMEQLVAGFQRSIAQDSARNEYVYHAKIHQWFAQGQVSSDVEALNRRVYADLFLTPGSDAWLGLAPSGAYTALPNDGLVGNAAPSDASQVAAR